MSEIAENPRRMRIAVTSRLMAWLTLFAALILPVAVIAYWLIATPAGLARQAQLPSATLLVMNTELRLVAAAITLIPVVAICWGLLRLRACFLGFAKGELFAPTTIAGFRDFSLGLVATAVLGIPSASLLSLAVSGGRQLSISISSNSLLMLCVAGAMSVVGWVLGEAAAIAEENASFV